MTENLSSLTNGQKQVSTLLDLIKLFAGYAFKKKWWIMGISLFVGIGGASYNYYKASSYKASLLFAIDDEGGDANGYLNLAAQFGISLGSGGGGSAFKGENLLELFKSRYIIEKTLMNEIVLNGKKDLMINHLIRSDFDNFKKTVFSTNNRTYYQDSVVSVIYMGIVKYKLNVSRVDKRLIFVSASFKSHNQYLAKQFVEQLLENVIKFYTETKTKKTRQNVSVITKELDSVKALMTGAIYKSASDNDLNVNPIRQLMRAPIQRTNVDAQVYTIAYGEIMKNLEIAKMNLMKETPLVQIIDRPILPLENDKSGRLAGLIIWGFVAFVCLIIFYYFKFLLRLHQGESI